MPPVARSMSPVELKRLPPGSYAVGGVAGLMLIVKDSGAKNWILRVTIGGRRRELGLGPYPEVTLADARRRAAEDREAIRQGRDPAAERAAARQARKTPPPCRITVESAAVACYEAHKGGFSSEKNARRWLGTLETHVFPKLGAHPIAEVTVKDIVVLLEPVWLKQNETAQKVRGRLEKVFDYVVAHKMVAPMENPCRWKGNLQLLLPKPGKDRQAGRQPSLPWRRAPEWWKALVAMPGTAPLALQFLALTAVRSAEVTDAVWAEFDLTAKIWTIPAARTKTGKAHSVPLSGAAIAILERAPREVGSPFVFTAPRGESFSNMALSAVMRRMQTKAVAQGDEGWLDEQSKRPAVPHGLRATFRTWAAEAGVDRDIAEMALGHVVGSAVERAYQRSGMVEKRREVMEAWAQHLTCGKAQRPATAPGGA